MLDSEVFGDEDTDAEAEDNSAEDAEDSSKEESKTDEKSDEDAESKAVSLEDFLKDNPDAQAGVEKLAQAEADKRFENARRRAAADARRTERATEALRVDQEQDDLAEKGEFDAIGKSAVEDKKLKKAFKEAAQQTAGFIEETIRTRPELLDALGEDKITEVGTATRDKGGDVIDFVIALNDAVSEVRVEKAKTEMEKTIATEVKAALQAEGLIARTEEAEAGADEELTRSTKTGAAKTRAQNQDDFIDGKLSLEKYTETEDAYQKSAS